MNVMGKICKRCLKEKPLDEFGKSDTTPDGLQSWCRECIKLYSVLNRKYKDVGGVKLCRKCHEIKPKTEFYPNRGKKDGLQSYCKDCCKEHGRLRNGSTGEYRREEMNLLGSYPVESLIDELKRRGYVGELKITKTIRI